MDADQVSSAIHALITGGIKYYEELLYGIAANATQGLNVVNTNLIHQHGGVGDDPGLIAALQAAAGSPAQGAIQK